MQPNISAKLKNLPLTATGGDDLATDRPYPTVIPKEQRKPTIDIPQSTLEGRDEMIKASMNLQDLRKRIFIKAKADFGWNRWSREWLYDHLGSTEIIKFVTSPKHSQRDRFHSP